jgi:hypothetical protein
MAALGVTEPVIASLLATVMASAFDACWAGEEESVTCTVKLDWPPLVGVPVIVPFLFKLRPVGKEPEAKVHEYGSVPPEARSVVEYAVPTVPLDNELVVIASGDPLATIVIEKALDAFCTGEEVSVTCTVKLDWPPLVGVPLIVPLWLKVRPAGRDPEANVHEYGSVPPEAVSAVEYAVPTVPLGNELEVIASGDPLALIVMEKALDAFCTGEEESVTCAVKLDWPALVGVPLIVPFVLKLRPAGRVPDANVHEYGSVPPDALSVVEYAVPTVPLGNEVEVIASAGTLAFMVMEKGLIAFCTGEEESVTCSVKLDWPGPVGVPLIVPFLLKVRPTGNVPDTVVQEYGAVPPVAATVVE